MTDFPVISRQEALDQGLPTYFTGKPCKHGHVAERRTANKTCVECARATIRKWHSDNRDKANANSKKWRQANRAKKNADWWDYKTKKLMAQGAWNFRDEIKQIYANCPEGYEVDHIFPLRGSNSCGLHVPWNLQYLPAAENRKKGNRIATEHCF